MYIYLKNKNKEIVAKSLIDDDQNDNVSKYKWCLNHGYVYNSTIGFLHRFLLNCKKEDKLTVDHINNDKLDNRIENLYLSTKSEQSQNKKNTKKTAIIQSKYIGVSWHKSSNKWIAMCKKNRIGYWSNELHAAWAYDNYVKCNFTNPKHNNIINKPSDFIEYIKNIKTNINTGVYFKNNKWEAKAKGKYIGMYETENEAVIKRNEYLNKLHIDIPIKFNINNIPFVEVFDNKNNITYQMLYDIDDYKLIKNKNINYSDGYGRITINKKLQLVHRLITNATNGDIVDHINNNKLDNRKQNLRIVNHSINNQNIKKKGGTSIYKGVFYLEKTNNWKVNIQFNKKRIYLGIFDNEKNAGLAYNKKAIELYGNNCMLNIIS